MIASTDIRVRLSPLGRRFDTGRGARIQDTVLAFECVATTPAKRRKAPPTLAATSTAMPSAGKTLCKRSHVPALTTWQHQIHHSITWFANACNARPLWTQTSTDHVLEVPSRCGAGHRHFTVLGTKSSHACGDSVDERCPNERQTNSAVRSASNRHMKISAVTSVDSHDWVRQPVHIHGRG